MAVYKGREVILLGKANGADESPLYRILHKDGQEEQVKLSAIQLTDDEVKGVEKDQADQLSYHQKIDDKDLQWVRDSQNKEKIEQAQGKTPVKSASNPSPQVQSNVPMSKKVK